MSREGLHTVCSSSVGLNDTWQDVTKLCFAYYKISKTFLQRNFEERQAGRRAGRKEFTFLVKTIFKKSHRMQLDLLQQRKHASKAGMSLKKREKIKQPLSFLSSVPRYLRGNIIFCVILDGFTDKPKWEVEIWGRGVILHGKAPCIYNHVYTCLTYFVPSLSLWPTPKLVLLNSIQPM